MRYLNGEEFNPSKEHLRYIAPAIAAAIIGGAASIGGSMLNRNNDMNLLKYQNWYNSPEQIMKRGMAAGINPNALAQGIAGAPGVGNMAQADMGNVSDAIPSDFLNQIGNSFTDVLNAQMMKSKIKNIEEDTRSKEINNDYNDATMDTRIQQAVNNGAITASQAEKARLELERYPELLDISVERAYADLEKARSEKNKIDKDIEVSDRRIAEINKNIDKLEQDIKTSKSQEEKNQAEAALAREKTNLAEEETRNQQIKNNNLEVSGEEMGWKAEYFAIEQKDGKEAADKWLTETLDITAKVAENSSNASAQGQQNVTDETPQGQIKKQYQDQMNNELRPIQEKIADLQAKRNRADSQYYKNYYDKQIKSYQKDANKVMRKYRNKMRRVDRGSSIGGSAFGFGVNAGG